jgi:hypothetical protein
MNTRYIRKMEYMKMMRKKKGGKRGGKKGGKRGGKKK